MIRSRGVGIRIDTLIQNAGIPNGSLTCRTTLVSWSQVKVIPFFFLKIYLKFRVIYRGGDRSSILQFTPQVSSTAKVRQRQNQEQGSSSDCPTGAVRTQAFESFSTNFPSNQQGGRLEVEELGVKHYLHGMLAS